MLRKVIENLENVRRERGISAHDLSLKLGQTPKQWSMLRTRKRRLTLETYIQIARILNVSPTKLLKDSLNGKDSEIVL